MKSAQRTRALLEEPPQRCDRRPALAVHQQALGRAPPPRVRVRQLAHELLVGSLPELDPDGTAVRATRRGDPPEAAAVLSGVGLLRVVVHVAGGPLRVLDHLAVIVHEVERAVRPHRHVDGTEPGVGGGQELDTFPGAPRREGRPRLRPDVAMHEVLDRLRDERRSAERLRERSPEVEVQAAGGRELAGLGQELEARAPRDRIHDGVAAVVGDVVHGRARGPAPGCAAGRAP